MPLYGFQLYNGNGILLANNTDFNYGLIYEKDSLSVPTGGALLDFASYGEELIFVRNTGTTWVAYDSTYRRIYLHEATPTGTAGRRYRTTGTVDVRVYTTFRNLTSPAAGQPYGIQVFDDNNNKTFDSTYPIPLVNALVIGTIPTPSDGNASPTSVVNLPGGISSTPWLEVGCIAHASSVMGWHYNSSTANAGMCYCARISSNQLQLSVGITFVGPTFTTSTNLSGQGTNKAFYICNSAVVSDLSAIIVRTSASNSNTCGFTSPATTCTTTQTFQVNTFGGNGQALTYSWSIIAGSGQHSISGSNTNSTVTVVGTNTAGTRPCILQCTVSQNGSTPTSPTFDATTVYSANPLTGSINYTSGTTSCNYYSPSTSCSTTETLTMSLSGGDGTGITYAWDFTTNTGGFSFSGAINTSSATIVKNAVAGTYDATIRCTVVQSGITYYFTRNISHPHTNYPPLSATITNWANSSSCTHPATSCTSTTQWRANPSGGNGQAVSYLWSFVSNTGGFTMTNSTSQIVTVSTTSGGTVTLNCTIKCVVSQTGSTSVEPTQAVTHTHTDTGGGGY